MERGEDLLALALLMPTLRDWLVICQRRVPVVFGARVSGSLASGVIERRGWLFLPAGLV